MDKTTKQFIALLGLMGLLGYVFGLVLGATATNPEPEVAAGAWGFLGTGLCVLLIKYGPSIGRKIVDFVKGLFKS